MSEEQISAIEKAKELIEQLAIARPPEVTVSSIGVRDKAPYKAQVIRGALIWRTEELGRAACMLLSENKTVAGIILTRAVFESAALIWRLRDLIEARSTISIEVMDDTLMKMLVGTKIDQNYAAINIVTLVGRLDKRFPGFKYCYDTLSEFAHPNFSGVARSYSKIISSEFRVDFKRIELEGILADETLVMGLAMFKEGYNSISDLFENWVKELDRLGSLRRN